MFYNMTTLSNSKPEVVVYSTIGSIRESSVDKYYKKVIRASECIYICFP